jgi:hypothetical protein
MCKILVNTISWRSFCGIRNRDLVFMGVSSSRSASESVSELSSPPVEYWRSDWIYRKSTLNYDDLTVSIQAAYYHWWKTIKCLNEKKQSLTILCRAKSLTKVKILWKRVKSCCSALTLPHTRSFSWYLLWFVWTSAGNF